MTVQDDEIRQLLREIRDAQREQLGQLYRRLVLAGGTIFVLLLVLLVYLLARWSSHLF